MVSHDFAYNGEPQAAAMCIPATLVEAVKYQILYGGRDAGSIVRYFQYGSLFASFSRYASMQTDCALAMNECVVEQVTDYVPQIICAASCEK